MNFNSLALSDLLFNIALLIRGIHDLSKRHSNNLCIIISFLSHLAELLSACYTVSFTIQRYTAVRYPLKVAANHHSSPFISLLIIFMLSTVFCLVLSSVNPYIDCHEELRLTWFIADALLSFVIPCVLILLFNTLIVNFIRKHSRSQISVQSTLIRKKKSLKTFSKPTNQDETCFTDNNTMLNTCQSLMHFDDNENTELKNRRDESDQRILSSLVSLIVSMVVPFGDDVFQSSDQTNFESGFNNRSSPMLYRLSVLSRPSTQQTRVSSNEPLTYRISSKSFSSSNDNEILATISTRTSQSIRVTRMLVLVSTCFLILNAPAHICVIAMKIYTILDAPTSSDHHMSLTNETLTLFEDPPMVENALTPHLLYMAVCLTQWIAYASYSINFFLYSFSGIAFRTSLRQLVKKFRKHRR